MPKVSSLKKFLLSLAFGAGLAATAAAEPVVRLTFEEALKLVETTNLNVMISRETVQQAVEAKMRARADLFPQLNLNANQSRSMSSTAAPPGRPLDLHSNRFNAQLAGSLALLDTTRIANFESQRFAERAARSGFDSNLQTVLDSVGTLYFTHLRNLRRLELNQANIERAIALRNLARSQLDAGVATQIDVTRAEAQLAVQELALLQQQTVVFNSEQQLKRALQIAEEARLELEDFAALRGFDAALADLSGVAVLGRRSDFVAATETLEQNRLERSASRLQQVPTINLTSSFGYASAVIFDGDERRFWTLGAALNVPVFDGFRIGSNKRLADSRVRAQELRVRDLQRQIGDEARFAVRDAQSRLAQIGVAEKNAALAAEELRLARIRFEQGVADNREIVDAQNSLAQANDNLVDAIFQYNLSRLELARIRGDVRILLAESVTGEAATRLSPTMVAPPAR